MNGYYLGKTKVVCHNLMCFPVNTQTLEPLACSSYDPYAWIDPDPEPDENITFDEWLDRIDKKHEQFKLNYRYQRT